MRALRQLAPTADELQRLSDTRLQVLLRDVNEVVVDLKQAQLPGCAGGSRRRDCVFLRKAGLSGQASSHRHGARRLCSTVTAVAWLPQDWRT